MERKIRMINVLHLGLSYRCNMACKHCFVTKKKDKLVEEDYYRIIDTLFEEGLFIIYYTFGEPLLSELFDKVSTYANKKGMVQILMTNGYLIDEGKIAILKKNHIQKVCISIDHSESEMHDMNRNHKGAYVKALNAIKLLLDHGIHTEMSVTVNDNNVSCLEDIYHLGEELNIEFISFLRERKDGYLLELEKEEEYIRFFEKMAMKSEGVQTLFHDMRLLPTLRRLKESGEINDSVYERYFEMNCCHSQYTLSIEPSGEVGRCNLRNDIIGKMLETSLKEIIGEGVDNCEGSICCTSISE